MHKLHLAVACPGCGMQGSVAAVAIRQSQEMSKRFAVTLLSDSVPAADLQGVRVLRVSFPRFNYLRRFCHVPNEYSFVSAIRKNLQSCYRQTPIDLFICHGHPLAAIAGRYLKRRYCVPLAMVCHGDIYQRPSGTYDLWTTWFYRVVTRPAYRSADLVFAPSPYMASCAVSGGARTDAVHVLRHGVDPAEIGLGSNDLRLDRAPGREGGALRLLYVGRLSVEKGISVLLEACRQLTKLRISYELNVAGAGALKPLVDDVATKKATMNVKLLGKVKRSDLAAHYRAADVVCVPSLDEAFGLVVVEALMCGTTVIASRVGGIPSIVRDGHNGLLVPPGSPGKLASAIERLAANREMLATLTSRAKSSVYPRFLWKTVGQEMQQEIAHFLAK